MTGRIWGWAAWPMVFWATSVSAQNGAKIEGAFGFKLGDTFEPTKMQSVAENFDIRGYEFVPKQPNPAFSTYLVATTPTSHLIYKIIAVGKSPDPDQASRIIAVVSQKYSGPAGRTSVQNMNRSVNVLNLPKSGEFFNFAIIYEDSLLAQKARDENAEKKQKELSKDVDTTGL